MSKTEEQKKVGTLTAELFETKEQKESEAMNKAAVLADEHWNWLQSLLEKVYKDAFIHGYKHGRKKS